MREFHEKVERTIDQHPHHISVHMTLVCKVCSSFLYTSLERRRQLDEANRIVVDEEVR